MDPPAKLDAVEDVAPLVGPAELRWAADPAGQLEEVVGLEGHAVDFETGWWLLAVEPQLDAVEGQHPVDREMLPHLTQERDVFQRVEPVAIVDHDGVARAFAEGQESLEDPKDSGNVRVDLFMREELPALVLAARI